MKKEEVIADLYSLRAGLSVISEKTDIVKKCEATEYSISCEIAGNDRIIEGQKKQCEKVEADRNNKELEIEKTKSEYKKITPKVDSAKGAAIIFFLIFGFFVGMGIFVVLWQVAKLNVALSLVITVCIVLIPTIIFYTVLQKKNVKRAVNKSESEKREIYKRVNSLKYELEILDKKVEEENNNYTEKANLNTNLEKKLNDTKLKHLPIISEQIEDAKVLEAALIKQYNSLIIPADWKNIDLIIFYLQTGRADNMKEALQLADRQRQTDAIVSEIRQANVSICSEIRGGFKTLGVAMAQCFNLLSSQINAQHIQMVNALQSFADRQDRVVGAIDELKDQNKDLNSQLVSATQLNNSLQAKANATSDQLKADLEYMQYRMGMRN